MKRIRLETLRTQISKRLRKIPSRLNKLQNEQGKLLTDLRLIENLLKERKKPYVKEIEK